MAMFIRVQLDPTLHQLVTTQASDEGRSVSNLVRFAIRQYLAEHVKPKGVRAVSPAPASDLDDIDFGDDN